MVFLIALCITIFSFFESTQSMVESAFSIVRREGDSVPLCAMDQPSAVKSTVGAIWCGIECITSLGLSSTCHSFSYFDTTNKCQIFLFTPTNYAVEDSCVTYAVIVSTTKHVQRTLLRFFTRPDWIIIIGCSRRVDRRRTTRRICLIRLNFTWTDLTLRIFSVPHLPHFIFLDLINFSWPYYVFMTCLPASVP